MNTILIVSRQSDPIQSLMHRFKRSRAPLHETFHPHLFTINGATDALYSFKKNKTNAKQQDLLDIGSYCIDR